MYVKAENIMSNIIGAGVGFQHKHLGERVWRILVALQDVENIISILV